MPADFNILVLENCDSCSSLLLYSFNKEGLTAVFSKRVNEAKHFLDEYRFDIAVLDLVLDDGLSFEIIEAYPNLPIIVATAVSNPFLMDKFKTYNNVKLSLVKPYDYKILITEINKWIGNSLKKS